MKRAAFGDVHGNLKGMLNLIGLLRAEGVEEIYHLGDLIDRGDDPEGVIRYCVETNMKGVLGNHDEAMLRQHLRTLTPPKKADKLKSYEAILRVDGAVEYLESLPKFLITGRSILVHAGVDPFKPIEKQNSLCCYVAMVNPREPGMSRWWSEDRKGRSEEQNRADGWERWYRLYGFPYDVYHGHSVYREPDIYDFGHGYYKYGLDTGGWFSGMHSAAIFTDDGFEKFVSTPRVRDGWFHESDS